MNTDPRPFDPPDAAQVARLERLASRRSNPARPSIDPGLAGSTESAGDLDAALAARIARLADRTHSSASSPASSASPKRRRRHPAQHSRTAALALSFLTTSGLAYTFVTTDATSAATPETAVAPTGIVAGTSAPATSTSLAATTRVPAVPSATAAPPDTAPPTAPVAVQVNGEVFSNRYGDTQVQATFNADGTLAGVDVLQVPYRDGKSVRINDRAVPVLNSEALTAQSANVDTVSGATYTTHDYRQSLQSAIDIARSNGLTTIA